MDNASLRILISDESAQGLVEYALVLAFVALIIVSALSYFGKRTNNSLSNSEQQMPG